MENKIYSVISAVVLGGISSWLFSVLKNHKVISVSISIKSISFVIILFLFVLFYPIYQQNEYKVEPADADYLIYSRFADIHKRPEPESEIVHKRKRGLIISVTGRVVGTDYVRVGRFGIPIGYVHKSDLTKIEEQENDSFLKKSSGDNLASSFYLGSAKNGVLHGNAIRLEQYYGFSELYQGNFKNNKYPKIRDWFRQS